MDIVLAMKLEWAMSNLYKQFGNPGDVAYNAVVGMVSSTVTATDITHTGCSAQHDASGSGKPS